MGNPDYNTTLATSLSANPPFFFQGVVMHVFPLKAQIDRLQRFCDLYLNNTLPAEIGYFRPSFPYVFLSMINYGRMASLASNLGWVAQNEILFGLWLDWYRHDGSRLVYHDSVSLSPFIYVDDATSQLTGREVYGWPKVHAWLRGDVASWARNPRYQSRLLSVEQEVVWKAFVGEHLTRRVVIEIDREAPFTFTQFPPDPSNAFNPMMSIPRAVSSSVALMGDWLDLITELPFRGYPPGSIETVPERLASIARDVDGFSKLPFFNTVNLKQFRDSERPHDACYEALIQSKMETVRYNEGGMLGDLRLLRGDPSGGYSIEIHRYPTLPVVEAFGLQIEGDTNGEQSSVTRLKPYFPFWADLDIRYHKGEVAGWRTLTRPWSRGPSGCGAPVRKDGDKGGFYNTTRGAALISETGPFELLNVSQRIIPLRANREKLQRLCNEYLANDFYEFEPMLFGSNADDGDARAYLIIQNPAESVYSGNNPSVGYWGNQWIRIGFPVEWYEKENGTLLTIGFVFPFVFVQNQFALTTYRELYGFPVTEAKIESPAAAWSDPSPEDPTLLRMSTRQFVALNEGETQEDYLVLEIAERSGRPDTARPENVGMDHWADKGLTEVLKRTQTLHLRPPPVRVTPESKDDFLRDLLALGSPFATLGLKQFRDAEQPSKACYQAIVNTKIAVSSVSEVLADATPIQVRFFTGPELDIVDQLGLKYERKSFAENQLRHVIVPADEGYPPVTPYWFRGNIRMGRGANVCWRAGEHGWTRPPKGKRVEDAPDFLVVTPESLNQALASVPAETRNLSSLSQRNSKKK